MYVITNDLVIEVKRRLVASEKDKILVLNSSGDIFSSFSKPTYNMLDELKLNKEAYLDFLELFKNKTDFWEKNGYLEM